MVGLTADFTAAAAALAQQDRALGAIIERVGPCTLGQTAKTTELLQELAIAIIHQQLSQRAAASIQGRFLALYGNGQDLTPAALLATPAETLRAAGLSRPKVHYLQGLARQIEAGLPSLAELATWEDAAILETLTAIAGIGRWTVEMLLIFRLYRPNVWPSQDLGIRKAVGRLLGCESGATPQAVAAVGERWQPTRTVAAWYLWRSLEV